MHHVITKLKIIQLHINSEAHFVIIFVFFIAFLYTYIYTHIFFRSWLVRIGMKWCTMVSKHMGVFAMLDFLSAYILLYYSFVVIVSFFWQIEFLSVVFHDYCIYLHSYLHIDLMFSDYCPHLFFFYKSLYILWFLSVGYYTLYLELA